MSIFYRFNSAIIGLLCGFLFFLSVSFLASELYQFDIMTFFIEAKSFAWGALNQYWFLIVLSLILIMLIPSNGFIQFTSLFLITFTVMIGRIAYSPAQELEIIKEMETLPASALSYQCSNVKCEIDSIQLKSGTTLNIEKQDTFIRLFMGHKINVVTPNKQFYTNNATMLHHLQQIKKDLNQDLLKQKAKEVQDAKTDTAIKFK